MDLFMARTIKRLSQTDVAERLGISQPTISRVEAGKITLPPEKRRQCEKLLDTPIDWKGQDAC
jgi:transcriptional regulator with XRE-family HTH domain